MTAEVAIANRQGVALAADSASTVGSKVSTSANKVFALMKRKPVGVMIYNCAEFMGIPLETLIKLCRQDLGDKDMDDVKAYLTYFLEFLGQRPELKEAKAEEIHIGILIREFLESLTAAARADFYERMSKRRVRPGSMPRKKTLDMLALKAIEKAVGKARIILDKYCIETNISVDAAKEVANKHKESIFGTLKGCLKEFLWFEVDLSPYEEQLTEIVAKRLAKLYPRGLGSAASGIVVAGFGCKQIYPAIHEVQIEGFIGGQLKYSFPSNSDIVVSQENSAAICPFAQAEDTLEVALAGIASKYKELVLERFESVQAQIPKHIVGCVRKCVPKASQAQIGRLQKVLKEGYGPEQIEAFRKELRDFARKEYRLPVLRAVGSLTVSELAAAAESLVNLSALRKKLSRGMETVAGPIDVAVITKCDGFIWIKRKHYFDASMNPQFMMRYANTNEEPKGLVTAPAVEGEDNEGTPPA